MQHLASPYFVPYSPTEGVFEEFSTRLFYEERRPVVQEACFESDGHPEFFYSIEFQILQTTIGKVLVQIVTAKEVPADLRETSLRFAESPEDVRAFQLTIESLPSEANFSLVNDSMEVFLRSRITFVVQSPFDPPLYLECIDSVNENLAHGASLGDARVALIDILAAKNLQMLEFKSPQSV